MPRLVDPATVAAAHRLADDHATRAGVRIEPITTAAEAEEAATILRDIWGGDPTALPGNAIRALAHAGNYTVTVHDERAAGRLIGASVAFFCEPEWAALHSHITGLLASERGRDIGTAVKLHQRAWALDLGLTTVVWTFDPLIARNAHFNLAKLGARVTHYLVDFYGEMADAVNAGDESDRLEVEWDLTAAWPVPPVAPTAPPQIDAAAATALTVGADGEPVVPDAPVSDVLRLEVPRDIGRLRSADPDLGRRWRRALRATLTGLLDDGYTVAAFADHSYVLTRGAR